MLVAGNPGLPEAGTDDNGPGPAGCPSAYLRWLGPLSVGWGRYQVSSLTQTPGEAGGRTIDEAGALLECLRRSAESSSRANSLLEVMVLHSMAQVRKAAARRSGVARTADLGAALTTLEECLELAGPEGYIRLFLDEGTPMARLLAELIASQVAAGAERSAAASYAAHLLAVFPAGAAGRGMPGAGSVLPEPLTEREVDVLRLLAAGMANKEMAERLFVSEGTVKTHVHNLLRKLEAKGRIQALVRARELGLL